MLREGSRLRIGGVTGTEAETVTEAEEGVSICVSPRRQRSEEREKRLRGRGSSVVGLKECMEGVVRSGGVRSDAEPRRRSRL